MAALGDDDLIGVLKERFLGHPHRHPGLGWPSVEARLQASPASLKTLRAMEESGGEPDVVGHTDKSGKVVFVDCSAESPAGRRSLCYDRAALDARKKDKPAGSAIEAAAAIGAEILTEAQYRELQTFGELDRKTSSWILTPAAIRDLGGALFCDRRYGAVFVYHNGAESYYAARGFRTRLCV